MLPVCSATSCTSHSQIFLNDGFRYLSRSHKAVDGTVRWLSGDASASRLSSGMSPGVHLQNDAVNFHYTEVLGGSNEWPYTSSKLSDSLFMGGEHLRYVGDSIRVVAPEGYAGETVIDNADALLDPTGKEPASILDNFADGAANVPDASSMNTESLQTSGNGLEDFSSQANDSVVDLVTKGQSALNNSVDKITSTITDTLKDSGDGAANVPDASSMNVESLQTSGNSLEDFSSQANDSITDLVTKGESALNNSVDKFTSTITDIIKDGDDAFGELTNKVLSSVDQTGELTRNKLSSLPSNLKEVTNEAGGVALELLRKAILVIEDSLVKGGKYIFYSYEGSKEYLPPEIQNVLGSFEEKTGELSRPVAMVFLQVYSAIEGLERSLGLDPMDPIVPFVLFLGATSTLWAVYWVVSYSGYAGDLSPKLAFELLKGKESSVLIDVRPEDLKQRDGIPDLRRAARFRYADVSLPKVDGSLRKLMKSSRDLDDLLIASVIRNLKNVQDRSKVIVMDADGSRAKGIARSLRKLGIKRPYVLQGGFQSWVKEGLRVKELRLETALTIFNEEAEAILEELSPSPVQLLGIGVGSIAALYALIEWEKSLQLIGVVGIAQTIYSRVTSYEDSEDFRKDVSSLFSPVALGAQALASATGKVDTNGNGLPVMPSSSDVQSRVLQAAAKHESQPSDGSQDSVMDSTTTADENAEQSEA